MNNLKEWIDPERGDRRNTRDVLQSLGLNHVQAFGDTALQLASLIPAKTKRNVPLHFRIRDCPLQHSIKARMQCALASLLSKSRGEKVDCEKSSGRGG